jgi:hypothetical protein
VSEIFELVLYQIGLRCFASDAETVTRVGAVRSRDLEQAIDETALGRPFAAARGLTIVAAGEERTLLVDQVLGMRSVSAGDLRPLPPFILAWLETDAVQGMALVDDVPTPIIHLLTLVSETTAAGPNAPAPAAETR